MAKGRTAKTMSEQISEVLDTIELNSERRASRYIDVGQGCRYIDVGQCCKCGARSKITPIDNGTHCGVCSRTITVT